MLLYLFWKWKQWWIGWTVWRDRKEKYVWLCAIIDTAVHGTSMYEYDIVCSTLDTVDHAKIWTSMTLCHHSQSSSLSKYEYSSSRPKNVRVWVWATRHCSSRPNMYEHDSVLPQTLQLTHGLSASLFICFYFQELLDKWRKVGSLILRVNTFV